MGNYEVMLIVKADLSDEAKKGLFTNIADVIAKHGGKVNQAAVWSERRKLTVPINKFQEGVYYLVNFTSETKAVKEISRAYKLNENILRFLFTRLAN